MQLELGDVTDFVALMDQSMPEWAFYQRELNRLSVRQEQWPNPHTDP